MPENGSRNILRLLRAIRADFFVLSAKKKANKCKSINDIFELSFDMFVIPFGHFRWRVRPIQVKEEITCLLEILAQRRPKVILEIGTANGGTLLLFARVSSPDGMILSVDMPGGRFGGGYPEWKIPFYKSFATHRQKILLIREDSHAPSALATVKTFLEGRKLDLLFIDGDHTYEGVKMDFEMYSKLVNKGGIIAFHDISPGPPENVGDVPRFWNEIKHHFRYNEIVMNLNQNGCGIGVVYVE